jgi:hypothetical protein
VATAIAVPIVKDTVIRRVARDTRNQLLSVKKCFGECRDSFGTLSLRMVGSSPEDCKIAAG